MREYKFSEREAELFHELIDDRLKATKNWIVSAVEDGRIEDANLLIVRVRNLEKLYAKTNVEAHRDIDKITGGK